jgi:hypothetical protein
MASQRAAARSGRGSITIRNCGMVDVFVGPTSGVTR